MSSSHSSSSSFGSFSSSSVPSTDNAVNVEDDFNAPLWKYVTKLVRRAGGGGGNTKWKCNLCNVEFQGSYFRVKAHLLLIKNQGIRCCSFVSGKPDILDEITKLEKEAENRQKMSQPRPVPLPPSTSQFNATTRMGNLGVGNVSGFRLEGYEPSKKRKPGNTPLEKAMNVGARETLHAMIARMFYSAGLPFHLARNPYFVEAFRFATENYIPGYVPPGYNLLPEMHLIQWGVPAFLKSPIFGDEVDDVQAVA